MSYEPGIYVKNGVEREARSPRAAVALAFDGWKPKPADLAVEAPVEVVVEPETPAVVVESTPIPTPKAVADKAAAKKDEK